MPERPFYSIDFETFYTKEYSLKNMPLWAYVYDPRFDAYLMAVAGPDGYEWVGKPKDFPDWDKLHGADLIAHNAAFDGLVFHRLQQLGVIPILSDTRWYDTADMCAYLRGPRALKDAAKAFLGLIMSKSVRDRMMGQVAKDDDKELHEYAGMDAGVCYLLWKNFSKDWPEDEREMSRLNREAGWRGIPVSRERVLAATATLFQQQWEAEQLIPWEWHATPLAWTAMKEECRKNNLPIPSSFAKDEPAFKAWHDQYGDEHPWIGAVQTWRRTNMLLQKIRTLQMYTRDDDTFAYSCKYFGAGTGRMSGGGDTKFNVQNLPRDPIFGIDLRGMIRARPGYKFVMIDYAQVEARMLAWLVGDRTFVKAIESEGNIYQAYARKVGAPFKENLKKENAKLYQYYKAVVLSLGFGCGPIKFRVMAKNFGVELSEEESRMAVADYRQNNPLVRKMWNELSSMSKISAIRKENFELGLPSGRVLTYFEPTIQGEGEVTAMFTKGTPASRRKIYGGMLTENCLAEGTRVLTDGGWKTLESIGLKDLVYDGVDFVRHGGVVYKSVQACTEIDGVSMTPDHEVLTHEGWKTASQNPEPDRASVRVPDGIESRTVGREEALLAVPVSLRKSVRESGGRSDEVDQGWWNSQLWVQNPGPVVRGPSGPWNVQASRVCRVGLHEGAVPAPVAPRVEELRGPGYSRLPPLESVPQFLGGHGPYVSPWTGYRAARQQSRLRSRELLLGYSPRKLKEPTWLAAIGGHPSTEPVQRDIAVHVVLSACSRLAGSPVDQKTLPYKPVYDILNCGPRHRFVVLGDSGPFIVHNCIQATCRDLLRDGWLALDKAGYPPLFTVHDEFVLELPEADLPKLPEIKTMLLSASPWAKGFPLDVEIDVMDCYH